MTEQEQKVAKAIIGTLVFVILYMIIRDLSLASLAVSWANPNLAAGPFDLWTTVLQLLLPIIAAYVFVATKLGGGVVKFVTAVVAKVQSPAAPASESSVKYARADLVAAELKKVHSRLKAVEEPVKKWKAEEQTDE